MFDIKCLGSITMTRYNSLIYLSHTLRLLWQAFFLAFRLQVWEKLILFLLVTQGFINLNELLRIFLPWNLWSEEKEDELSFVLFYGCPEISVHGHTIIEMKNMLSLYNLTSSFICIGNILKCKSNMWESHYNPYNLVLRLFLQCTQDQLQI